jgi:hypothetical protein
VYFLLARAHVHACVRAHTQTHTQTHTHRHTHRHTHTQTYFTHTTTHTYTNTHTHTFTLTHSHIQTHTPMHPHIAAQGKFHLVYVAFACSPKLYMRAAKRSFEGISNAPLRQLHDSQQQHCGQRCTGRRRPACLLPSAPPLVCLWRQQRRSAGAAGVHTL